jgi:hypothetical protein
MKDNGGIPKESESEDGGLHGDSERWGLVGIGYKWGKRTIAATERLSDSSWIWWLDGSSK